VIVDSVASSACIATSNPWLQYLKAETVNLFPRGNIKVGDAKILKVSEIVNLRFHGKHCLKGYKIDSERHTTPAHGELTCHRVLVVS
jgi:hypothetical protein